MKPKPEPYLEQAGWESSGWINQCDPRGWTQACPHRHAATPPRHHATTPPHRHAAAPTHRRTAAPPHRRTAAPPQWYFRFYSGRRLAGGEDERQIARWSGVCGEKGRWKQNLIAKCMRDGKARQPAGRRGRLSKARPRQRPSPPGLPASSGRASVL